MVGPMAINIARRDFMASLGSAAAAWPLAARAQPAAKSYRVAYLVLLGDQDALIVKQRLDELGYTEGKNLIFDFRSADGQLERLPQLAAEFVKTNPDVIVTVSERRLPRRRRPQPQPYPSSSPALAIRLAPA
jgi:ABC-type uncharacterized transport system substrate-binding protein